MNLYALRREKLIKDLGDSFCLMLFSGEEIMKSEDEAYPFEVNRNFYYFTGLERDSMVLLLYKNGQTVQEHLFILPFDELKAKWVGGRMRSEEASDISGVRNVHDLGVLDDFVASIFNNNRKDSNFKFYFDCWRYTAKQADTLAIAYAKKLTSNYPCVTVKDAFPYMTRMRLVKDEYEVTCLKHAIEVTKNGIVAMIKSIKPGINEMSLSGVFTFVLAQNLCSKHSFRGIFAGGERATVLHYTDNNQVVNDGEMLLCDLGASFKNYCADISRTFPANGKFTDRQKELYDVVLNVQKLVEENAKPGVSLEELNNLVLDYYREELPKHGLTKDVREYYWHHVSHHLGLDTHDVNGGLGAVLEPGNVITNEPGLYVADEKIGIRIEDDLLITGTGSENLSVSIPKTTEDIEAISAS